MNGYYQYANWLAFLYYLRARQNVPAWLALVNFVGDGFDGSTSTFPTSAAGWAGAERSREASGLAPHHALSPYLVRLYPAATR